MGYLIVRIDNEVYSVRAPYGDLTVQKRSAKLAERHGFEIRWSHRKTLEERREWPLTAFAYTSRRADGYGRTGSQAYSFPARRRAAGRARRKGK